MIDPGPPPSFLLREAPTPEAWDRFFAHGRRRKIVMPTNTPNTQTTETQMAKPDNELSNGIKLPASTLALDVPVPGEPDFHKSPDGSKRSRFGTAPKVDPKFAAGDFKAKGKIKGTETARVEQGETTQPSASEPASQSSVSRGVKVKPKHDDDYSETPIESLLVKANKLGYKEQPAPNGGVRKMRVINFLRGKDKEKKGKGAK